MLNYESVSSLSKLFERKNHLILFLIIISICISLLITTITFAVLWNHSKSNRKSLEYADEHGLIGFRPLLPNDGKYIQWTILQLNDVYEILPLDQGRKGGLARVAHIRQRLLKENANTLTILAGDFLSPSALSQSTVNGSLINGKQMIDVFNSLGLDFVTFGNHEFDLNENDLIQRMNESKFTWICSNLFHKKTNQTFYSTIQYKLISIENQVNVLFIGLTIDVDKSYINIINQTSLVQYVQQFLQTLEHLQYDVLIAITHLDLQTDISLAENIQRIDFILGGHEHENYYLTRGQKPIPIAKADGNAFSVYIHRCAFHLDSKHLRTFSTLTKITDQFQDESNTFQIANSWFNQGIQGFQQMGFQPKEIVSCLPSNIQLDGRSTSVRNIQTNLAQYACQSLLNSTATDQTNLAIYNSGAIRIDDILRGQINQYDILRVFPFPDTIYSLSVRGHLIIQRLTESMRLKGRVAFLQFCTSQTFDQSNTSTIQPNLNYTLATITFIKNTLFDTSSVTFIQQFNLTQTQAFINYLKIIYPPC